MTKRICHLLITIPFLSLATFPAFSPDQLTRFKILEVHDGDSLKIDNQNRPLHIRLNHIDAPELEQKPWGELSRQKLNTLIKECKAELVLEKSGTDHYGRTLAELFCGSESLNQKMISTGLATVYIYAKFQNRTQKRNYLNSIRLARLHRLGFWSTGLINPYHWRAAHKKARLPKSKRVRQNRRVSNSEGKGFQ